MIVKFDYSKLLPSCDTRNISGLSRNGYQGPVSRKSRKLFGPENPFVNLSTACSGKPIFSHVVKVTKSKMIVKFDDLNPLRSCDKEGVVTPENGP